MQVGNINLPKSKAVVDASFVVSFLLPDESLETVTEVFYKNTEGNLTLISTTLLPYEVLNSLKFAFLRRRISKLLADKLARDFFKLLVDLEAVNFTEVFKLSLEKNITIYDASYLYLSLENKAPLLTLDRKLKRISRK